MIRKIIAVFVCFIIWMSYVIFLESQGIESKYLGGAIPAVILFIILGFVWKKITVSKNPEEEKDNTNSHLEE